MRRKQEKRCRPETITKKIEKLSELERDFKEEVLKTEKSGNSSQITDNAIWKGIN